LAIFYRGAAIGTYWHANDARITGFTPQQPAQQASIDRLMNHIVRGTLTSPYVSLSRSFGIAWNYALDFSRTPASATNPAFVYEIEIADPLPPGLSLLDPLREVVESFPQPESHYTYHHNGDNRYLLGVISPTSMGRYLRQRIKQPPPGGWHAEFAISNCAITDHRTGATRRRSAGVRNHPQKRRSRPLRRMVN
jgi:hypothetical protein